MHYNDVFVSWYKSQDENYKCISFWLEDPTEAKQTDIDDVLAAVLRARSLIRKRQTLPMPDIQWLLDENRIAFAYSYVNEPALDTALFNLFDPRTHPYEVEVFITDLGQDITAVELRTPYIASHKWLHRWLEEQGLEILSFLDLPRSIPKVTDKLVILDDRRSNPTTAWFMDKEKAILCKLAAPGSFVPSDIDDH